MPTQLCAGGAAKEANNVEVSRHTENQILEVLKTRDGATTELAQAGIRTVRKVWEELIELGFTQEDTADAIRSTPTVSLADCLDWLCITLEEHRLPRRFRSSYRPSDMTQAQLTVVAPTRRADTSEPAPAVGACAGMAAGSGDDAAAAAAAAAEEKEARAREEEAAAARERKEREEAESEAAARKQWILSMSGAGGGSDEDSGSPGEEEEEEGEDDEEEVDLAEAVNALEAKIEVLKIKSARARGDARALPGVSEVAAEGTSLSKQAEELHTTLKAAAQGLDARGRYRTNARDAKFRELQARRDLPRTSRMIAQVCVSVCLCVCVCVRAHASMNDCVFECMDACVRACMHACMHTICTHVCKHACAHASEAMQLNQADAHLACGGTGPGRDTAAAACRRITGRRCRQGRQRPRRGGDGV